VELHLLRSPRCSHKLDSTLGSELAQRARRNPMEEPALEQHFDLAPVEDLSWPHLEQVGHERLLGLVDLPVASPPHRAPIPLARPPITPPPHLPQHEPRVGLARIRGQVVIGTDYVDLLHTAYLSATPSSNFRL